MWGSQSCAGQRTAQCCWGGVLDPKAPPVRVAVGVSPAPLTKDHTWLFLITHGCDLTVLGPRTGHVLTSACLWGQLLLQAPGRLCFSAVSGFTGPSSTSRPATSLPLPSSDSDPTSLLGGPSRQDRASGSSKISRSTLEPGLHTAFCRVGSTSPSRGFGGNLLEDHVLPTVWAFGQTRLGDVFGMGVSPAWGHPTVSSPVFLVTFPLGTVSTCPQRTPCFHRA